MNVKYYQKAQREVGRIEVDTKVAGQDLDIRLNGELIAFFNSNGELYLCDFYKDDRAYKALKEAGIKFQVNPADEDTFIITTITE